MGGGAAACKYPKDCLANLCVCVIVCLDPKLNVESTTAFCFASKRDAVDSACFPPRQPKLSSTPRPRCKKGELLRAEPSHGVGRTSALSVMVTTAPADTLSAAAADANSWRLETKAASSKLKSKRTQSEEEYIEALCSKLRSLGGSAEMGRSSSLCAHRRVRCASRWCPAESRHCAH